MLNPFDDSYFMRQAIIEANKAFDTNEVPVGAVVVAGNQVIGRGYNLTEKLHDVTSLCNPRTLSDVRWRLILESNWQGFLWGRG
jgi:tRNA(adenine34) deaminase